MWKDDPVSVQLPARPAFLVRYEGNCVQVLLPPPPRQHTHARGCVASRSDLPFPTAWHVREKPVWLKARMGRCSGLPTTTLLLRGLHERGQAVRRKRAAGAGSTTMHHGRVVTGGSRYSSLYSAGPLASGVPGFTVLGRFFSSAA